MDETPKERTQRMREELRKKVLQHERDAKESGGKNVFDPPRLRRSIALPLFALAAILYGCSIYGYKKRVLVKDEINPKLDLKNAKDIADYDTREYFGNKFLDTEDEELDVELIRDDKKW